MRSVILASAFVGLAFAAPAPLAQDIEFDLIDSAPEIIYSTTALADATVTAQIITYDASAILESATLQITSSVASDATTELVATNTDAAAKVKRAACATQPPSYGPTSSPDTVAAFLANSDIASAATGASAPSGYTQQFSNLQGSNNAYGYMGYTTLKSYDVAGCAAKCDKINGCMSINIYFERDPVLDPSSDDTCNNPPSTTNIKCVFWGGPVTADNANNKGQWRSKFQVVIAGSNGYTNNTLVPPPGYSQAIPLGSAAINAPLDTYGFDTYMGSAIFTNGPFDAKLCADACPMKSTYNLAHPPKDGPVQTCQFFNTYIMYINNTKNLQGQYCAMYSETWSSSFATNTGQYRGNDHCLMEYSYAFSNTTDKGVAKPENAVYQAVKDIKWASYQPFCSSYLGYTVPSTTVSSLSTVSPVTTSTVFTTTTVTASSAQVAPRALITTISGGKVLTALTLPAPSVLSTMKIPANGTAALFEKRAAAPTPIAASSLSTPAVLTKYSSTILSSACSLQATPATVTSTITNIATTTLSTSTIISTIVSTETIMPSVSPTSVLTNGEFSEEGVLTGWYRSDYNVEVSNDEGVATYSYNAENSGYSSVTYQAIPGELGTQYHLTADISIEIADGDTCTVYLYTNSDYLWFQTGVTASQSWEVDVSGEFSGHAWYFYIYNYCSGRETGIVRVDNVDLEEWL